MSINALTGANGTDQILQQLMNQIDTNHDGQLSSAEFGAFLTRLLSASGAAQKSVSGKAASDSAPATGQYRGQMLGFDLSRIESAASSPKYAFATLAQNLAPTDANMQLIAQQLGAGVGHLDSQNNFMLDGDAGGYIGVRDRGFGPMWQWMAYNTAHPGPNGEIA